MSAARESECGSLWDHLVCPGCRVPVSRSGSALVCSGCGVSYRVVDGIPVLRETDESGQAAWFDHAVDEEFEIERPANSPALYGRLLGQKFRAATKAVDLLGASTLVVCGGSGMDAEFLARAGARVITSDLSLGAARRARERARRHDVEFAVIVSDATRLPFADRSFDVVYVHDGLHHLDRPLDGLAEMARVARTAVCVTEPARAAATALAVRLGMAEDVEEAGNRVGRLELTDVTETLERAGFRVAVARRYAMYYRHEPGWALRLLSRRWLVRVAALGSRLVAGVTGPVGNKLAVAAMRR